ncbi:MAG: glycosyltransferase [Rhodobacteraceae bacterium]|nr:glycosyltransferase [Paracoccaceae bacterium]
MTTKQPVLAQSHLDGQSPAAGKSLRDALLNYEFPTAKELLASWTGGGGTEDILLPCTGERPPALSVLAGANDRRRVFAFLPSAPDWSHLSLENDCGVINVLMPDWYRVREDSPALIANDADPLVRESVQDFLSSSTGFLEVYPVVEIDATVDSQAIIHRLAEDTYRAAFVQNLKDAALETRAGGMCLNVIGVHEDNFPELSRFVADVRSVFESTQLATCVVSENIALFREQSGIAQNIDYAVLKLFSEPWVGSQPAPLAAQDWFQEQANKALAIVGPDKLVIAIGNLAADWTSNRPIPETIGYSEAVSRISKAGAQIRFAPEAKNSFSAFVDEDGLRHQIWLLDAVSAHNQATVLRDLGVSNIAVWPLGYEDPTLWRVLNTSPEDTEGLRKSLGDVRIANYVSYRGEGPFLRYISDARAGIRTVKLDSSTSIIVGQSYAEIPEATLVERYGKAKPNQVALTFDDGPHEIYTKEILDTLRQTNTPATFFVVGRNVLKSPELIARMVDEGHELGSHTFWHPRMDQLSESRSVMELNSVQKLINDSTGYGVALYREPFLRGDGPVTSARARPMQLLQSLDYIVAGSDIVPPDWTGVSTEEIVSFVLNKVNSGDGNVVLLHDAGNDRSATVAAVPKIIKALREEGYEIVSLAQILGMEKQDLMPKLQNSKDLVGTVSFSIMAHAWNSLIYIFWIVIFIGATRSVFVLLMAFLRRQHWSYQNNVEPSCTVIIPAYNEEVVVSDCVRSVMASNYHNFKVIVVDDGSGDETLKEVLRKFGEHPRIQIICQQNQGKWRALNAAYSIVDTDIVVSIDADTRIRPDTISKLARHFRDPKIGAVAGKVLVENRVNLLTRLQSLEYTTSQNIDRRAAELINGILVVPGAIGAWRAEAVRKAGLYSGETQTEDADLTIAIIRAGYKVAYDETAVAATEAPKTINSLLKQRLRWSLGMLQVSWKHRRAIRQGGALGRIALPDLVIFGYLFPLLAPIADLYFFSLIYNFIAGSLSADGMVFSTPTKFMIFGYLALPLLDFLTVVVALKMDKGESFWMLLLTPFQRVFYRQLLYFSVLRAILVALTGRPSRWGKLERTGFVSAKGV